MTGVLALSGVLFSGIFLGAAPTPEPAPVPVAPSRTSLPCRPWRAGEAFVVDTRAAPLREVARIVSCALEINLLFAPPSLGRLPVTVISSHAVDRRGLLGLWRALLADRGLVTERRGAYRVIRRSL